MLLVDHGKAVDAGMNQEALESPRTSGRQRFNLLLVVRDNPAPGCPIHPALAPRRLSLRLQRRHVSRGRQAVQWHVDEESVAARRGGARCGVKSLPFRSPRFVYMHVRIDEPWENRGTAKIPDLHGRGQPGGRNNVADSLPFNQYSCRPDAGWGDHTLGEERSQAGIVGHRAEEFLPVRAYRWTGLSHVGLGETIAPDETEKNRLSLGFASWLPDRHTAG